MELNFQTLLKMISSFSHETLRATTRILSRGSHLASRVPNGRNSKHRPFHSAQINAVLISLLCVVGDMTFKVDGQTVGVLVPPPGGYRYLSAFAGSQDNPWGRGSKLAPFDREVK